jgi:hypothetical protein
VGSLALLAGGAALLAALVMMLALLGPHLPRGASDVVAVASAVCYTLLVSALRSCNSGASCPGIRSGGERV